MLPQILSYVCGPLENNVYLIADPDRREAALIDPSFEPEPVLDDLKRRGLTLTTILLTHAHFDHILGIMPAIRLCAAPPPVVLHPADLPLYRQGGCAVDFDVPIEIGPEPQQWVEDGQIVKIGQVELEVRHTPGHTPGHVIYYCPAASAAFCGDLIFAGSVGRTDLPGGSHLLLLRSIRQRILTLPPATQLLCGHGAPTTVAEEIASNPYVY